MPLMIKGLHLLVIDLFWQGDSLARLLVHAKNNGLGLDFKL
jgi:hypothetical protein